MPFSWVEAGRFTRATKVIAVADVVESVRLMEQDASEFIRRWHGFVGFVKQLLPVERGRMHKSLGDGLMLEFSDAQGCIRTALAMQAWFGESNQGRAPEEHVQLRIGAHIADFVADEYDIYGPDVNLAARIASLAGPGEIVISAALRERLPEALGAPIEDLGTCHLKHVKEPVRAFRIGLPGSSPVLFGRAAPAHALRPRIAVLPFAMQGEGLDDLIGEAVADDIVCALAKSDTLQVASRLSTAPLESERATLTAVQQDVGASYVLSGRARTHGEQLAVYTELADAGDGQVVWAHSFHGAASELGAADGQLLAHVIGALHAEVIRHEVARTRGGALHAQQGPTLLLAAIGLMHRLTAPDTEQARVMLEHLADRWRRHPAAHIWLAQLHVLRLQQGIGIAAHEQAMASEHAAEAVQCDPGYALALATEGWVLLHAERNPQAAEENFARALVAQPDHPFALLCQAEMLAMQGDAAQAREVARRAARGIPVEPLLYLRDYVDALTALAGDDAAGAASLARQALRRSARYVPAHCLLLVAQVERGDVAEARRTLQRLLELQPAFSVAGWRASFAGSPAMADRFSQALLRARARAG